ncbi:hypothetical protein [Anaerovorax odorimutans]|uniref:hypothetical protein n=1 Tax=Anaerovorax odorimutans TaxID=109327 RepID=UPI0003FAC0EF|nr:hypothetical protein [Anaerovorax odorimutans]
MIDGLYKITLKSPLGLKYGKMIIESQDNELSGTLEILNNINQIKGRILSVDDFEIYGEIKTPVGHVNYKLEGKMIKEDFKGIVKSSKGLMKLKGDKQGKE